MKTKFALKNYTMIISLVVVFVLFAILTEGRMLYPQNLSNLLLQNAYVLIMACGMLLCILTGGNIDLSVGATVCIVGAAAAQLLASGVNEFIVIIIGLLIGAAVGAWNGFWIGKIHIPPFVCTLSGMFVLRGLARAILGSKTVAITNENFLNTFASYIEIPGLDGEVKWSALIAGIAVAVIYTAYMFIARTRKAKKGYSQTPLGSFIVNIAIIDGLIVAYTWMLAHYKGIPVMALWVIAIVLLYAFITSKTAFGRYFYAVGGNEKATKLSGINTNKVYFMAYLSMSILAGLSGLLIAARIGAVNGDTGNAFEMDAIGACFIGGASAYGGSGNVPGIIVGAVLLGVINQGMSIVGLDSNWQYVVKGAVLLVAVIFDVLSNRKTSKV